MVNLLVFKKSKQVLIILLAPFFLSLLPILVKTKASKCAYVTILMACYWVSKALPIGITSLMPVWLFPLLGIMPADKVVRAYFKDIVMLFLGGLIVASAIELTRLHERIALKVLIRFGSNPKWLMLGFMIVTSFISLWITNTAATVMMLPIVDAVVKQLSLMEETQIHVMESSQTVNIELDNIIGSLSEIELNNAIKIDTFEKCKRSVDSEKSRKLSVGFMMACAFSATIGGMASLVGATPNMLLKGYIDRKHAQVNLNFLNYLLFALPIAIIMIFFTWIWLVYQWLPRKKTLKCHKLATKPNSINFILKEKYKKLGNVTWEQRCIGMGFVLLVLLWITRDLHFISGWSKLFEKNFVTDSTPVIIIVFLFFVCPKENIFKGHQYKHLLEWDDVQKKIPWDIMFLIGGGLVIADGFQESGLSAFVGVQLRNLSSENEKITLFIVMTFSALATEFTSNMSMASVLLPIVDSLAENLKLNPVYLLLPMILSVSLAFCLPIANPNNAIIFASGHIKIMDMITTGFVINIIGLLTVYLASNTWLFLIFNVKGFTEMQSFKNITFANVSILKN